MKRLPLIDQYEGDWYLAGGDVSLISFPRSLYYSEERGGLLQYLNIGRTRFPLIYFHMYGWFNE